MRGGRERRGHRDRPRATTNDTQQSVSSGVGVECRKVEANERAKVRRRIDDDDDGEDVGCCWGGLGGS